MKNTARRLVSAAVAMVLAFSLCASPSSACFKKETPKNVPQCIHYNIGCSNGTTMYRMSRTTYSGNTETWWYKCSICGYETGITFKTY